MSEMIERVARALALAEGGRFSGPGMSKATREFGWDINQNYFQKYADDHWAEYRNHASFVIAAMREPTETMCAVAGENNVAGDHYCPSEAWRLMMDEALK